MIRLFARLPSCPALLLGLVVVTACASPKDAEPPQVSVADIRVHQGSVLEQAIKVELRLRNPNNFDLPLEGMTLELLLDNKHVARGSSNAPVTIPRLGEIRVPVTASTNRIDLAQQALRIARSGQLDYRVIGLTYPEGWRNRGMPYDRRGRLRLLPEFSSAESETLIPL